MTILTEEDINVVTEILGITKERLLSMDEQELYAEVNAAVLRIHEAEVAIAEKTRQVNALRSECVKLRFGIKLLLRHKQSDRQEV